MLETLESEAPKLGLNPNSAILLGATAPSTIVVDGPFPMIEIPMVGGTTTPVVQVQVPSGMWIVSPFTAVCKGPLITAFTSLWLHVAAVNVPAALKVMKNGTGP
jgi:hypothetical protein